MATQPASNIKRQRPFTYRQMLAWGVIGVGIFKQFLYIVMGVECLPVILNPPGHLCPWMSLEFLWWFVLTLGSVTMYALITSKRLQEFPSRVVNPFYLYLVFLLFLVKPV